VVVEADIEGLIYSTISTTQELQSLVLSHLETIKNVWFVYNNCFDVQDIKSIIYKQLQEDKDIKGISFKK